MLAVLAGLMAMHGLATGHHASAHASSPPAVHAVVAVAAAGDVGATPHHTDDPVFHVPAAAEQLLTLSPAGGPGVALAVHLARPRHAGLLHRRRGAVWTPRARGVVRRSCPDLVSELCISRT